VVTSAKLSLLADLGPHAGGLKILVEEGGNPGSGVARCLFVEAIPISGPLSRLTTVNTQGGAASLSHAPAKVASLPGLVLYSPEPFPNSG
jgi:hypothetical protein